MVHCTADLRAAVVFDHETTPSLSAELTAVDRQGLSTTVQFNLTVQDTNDPPIVRALSMLLPWQITLLSLDLGYNYKWQYV